MADDSVRLENVRLQLEKATNEAKRLLAKYHEAASKAMKEPGPENTKVVDDATHALGQANDFRDQLVGEYQEMVNTYTQRLVDKNKTSTETAEAEVKRLEDDMKAQVLRTAGLETAKHGVQGGQLSVIPVFHGTAPFDAEGWLDLVERAKVQFSWNDYQVSAIAKNKLAGPAAIWMRALEKLNPEGFHTWIGHERGFKKRFEEKFLPPKTDQSAIVAVLDMKQRPNEKVSDYFDRVVLAVDKVNHNIPDTEKKSIAYQKTFHTHISTFFAAGLKTEIRQIVLGSNAPPANMEALRDQAIATELQLNTKAIPVKELVAVAQEDTAGAGATTEATDAPAENAELQAVMKKLEALTLQKNERMRDLATVLCFRCRKKGHYANTCSFGRGRGRGRGGRQSGPGRGAGGRGRGGGGRGRGYNNHNNNNNNGYYNNFGYQPSNNYAPRRNEEMYMDQGYYYAPHNQGN